MNEHIKNIGVMSATAAAVVLLAAGIGNSFNNRQGQDFVNNFTAVVVLGLWLGGAHLSGRAQYMYGPRGGRYTVENSYDGGVYKRYR